MTTTANAAWGAISVRPPARPVNKVISAEDPTRPLAAVRDRVLHRHHEVCVLRLLCGSLPVNALAMTKMYEFSTHDKRTLLFDKKRLYDIGERHLSDAKNIFTPITRRKMSRES